MSKRMRYLLFVLVVMMSLVLAACGGDDDDKKDDGDNSSADVALSQSFESEDGISVNYPESWIAQDIDGQIALASSAEALDAAIGYASENAEENATPQAPESGEIVVVLMAYPLEEMGMGEDATLDAVFDMMIDSLTGEGMEKVGEPENLTVGDFDARQLNITSDELGGDGFILALVDENNTFVTLIGITATGERDNFDDIVARIAVSVKYTAPAPEPTPTVAPAAEENTAPAATEAPVTG